MLTLIVDTATPAVTAALAAIAPPVGSGIVAGAEAATGAGRAAGATAGAVSILAEEVAVNARAHGELLAPAIDAVLRAAGVGPGDLAAVVAGVGPGPFTGLRVGLVTAAALADTLAIPVYGVCTLDALGWAYRSSADRVLVATDARRHEVYWAVYSSGERLAGPAVDRPSDVDCAGVGFATGDGALRYADVLGVPVRDEPRYPPAEGLAALAADRVLAKAPGEPLTPLYLRRPDAVAPGARKTVS